MNAPTLHPDLVALKVHVDRLHSLLAAPEPGLSTWKQMVWGEWQSVIALAGPPEPPKPQFRERPAGYRGPS